MKNIAIALSGGGFRAAAFSLGTLSYLQKIEFGGSPLLNNVKFMGSTSGGSITNITYNLGNSKNKSFSDIYTELLNAMQGEDLIANVFKILKDDNKWSNRREKNRNLINAFSIAYDEFLGHAEFKELFDSQGNAPAQLKEVCVNATEFTNGLSFRFQSQKFGSVNGKIGNNYIYFKDVLSSGRLLLADIMACSSCFSGGFEPFIFPDDFAHNDLSRETLANSLCFNANPFTIKTPLNNLIEGDDFEKVKNRFGMMDGGVADNQAIDSIFKANTRRKRMSKITGQTEVFDLIILTDVTSYFIDGYTLPLEEKRWFNAFTLQQVINLFKLCALIFLGIIIWISTNNWAGWTRILFIPLAVISIFYSYGVWNLYRSRKNALKEKSTWSIILFAYVNYFLTIRYSRIKQMVSSRLKSVFLLANDLYLKQIRRLYYEKIYSDPDLRDITVSNAIYDLSAAKIKSETDQILHEEVHYEKLRDPEPLDTIQSKVTYAETSKPKIEIIPIPKTVLINVAEEARLMPTTLWFDQFHQEAEMLKKIVTTGQFTICYNLLKYLIKKEEMTSLTEELSNIKKELLVDWQHFNENPYFLYNELDVPLGKTSVPM